jgi:hypothetical protein
MACTLLQDVEPLVKSWLLAPSTEDDHIKIRAENLKHTSAESLDGLLKVHGQFGHVVRHFPIRQNLGLEGIKGGVRVEHFGSLPLLFAYMNWLVKSPKARSKRHISNCLRGCKLYVEYLKARVKAFIQRKHVLNVDRALDKLVTRLAGVSSQLTDWSNTARSEGAREVASAKQNTYIQLTASLHDPDLDKEEQEELEKQKHMEKLLGVDARMELACTAASMDACCAIIDQLPHGLHGCPMPQDPLSRSGRDLAAAMEQAILRAFIIGMIIPPTRVSVLCTCKWGWAQRMGDLTCPRRAPTTPTATRCRDKSCPGNVIWIPGPSKLDGCVMVDWRHHKSAEHMVERVFVVKIQDKRMCKLLQGWCVWARAVHYYGAKDYMSTPSELDKGWAFLNRWTETGLPTQLTTQNFTTYFRRVCHVNNNFDCRKVRSHTLTWCMYDCPHPLRLQWHVPSFHCCSSFALYSTYDYYAVHMLLLIHVACATTTTNGVLDVTPHLSTLHVGSAKCFLGYFLHAMQTT